MNTFRRLSLILLVWLAAAPFAAAQTLPYRYDLLALLPDDFAVCVVLHDLRGHSARLGESDWLKQFRQSQVGNALFETPEMKQLRHWQGEMKKHLDLDWPALRDDILGDTLVLSYTPGPKNKPDDERGLFLVHVRKPERLQRLIDLLNETQKKSGVLKGLTEQQYKGNTYFRRDQEGKTQFYFLKDSLAVFTVKEETMQDLLDRRTAPKTSPWAKRFEKAGAERALVTMCVNPRVLDPELVQARKKEDPLPAYWRALDGIFVTLTIRDEAELRIAIQADAERLPRWASPAFTHTIPTTSLWQRFPDTSVVTVASMTDFAGVVEALKLLMPEKEGQKLTKDWGSLGTILELDLFKDVLPNIGPDWGVCMLPAKNVNHFPPMMFAIAVKPGSAEKPVDQALFKAAGFFAKIAVLQKPDAVRLETMKQGTVPVSYLTGDKVFPPGFQPACALKDGFLIFATTPEAIAEFRLRPQSAEEPKESTLLRVSTPELAKLLEQRRAHILSRLTERQQMTLKEAARNLENVIAILGLFDRMTLSQHGDAGQTSWILRLSPKKN